MAAKKQTTDKNSKTKKTGASKPDKLKEKSKFPKTYIRLRTVLDSLEIMSLRYVLKDKNDAGKIRRSEEIIADLMPILQKYQDKIAVDGGGECPEGYESCYGCCVPYPCP